MSLALSIALFFHCQARAQAPTSAAELLRDIEQLRVVGSVLYVAAHPDDENTRLLSWLADEQGVRTAYLSMTRGGGGQNLIGTEQSELLGVVRTGELLAARSIDGAEQRFTRARDFGYTKTPEEALATWGEQEALSDVVLAIRDFRPDVIITRFSADGGGHGHHTASARLAGAAFSAAADPSQFASLGAAPWQADRLLYNLSSWRLPDDFDPGAWPQADVGTYDPLTGRSVGVVAAQSRTMHKSQGFGSAPQHGPLVEYFESIDGTPLSAGEGPLAGLDLSWGRFEGTVALDRALAKAARRFDPRAPHESLPDLAKAHALMSTVPDPYWRAVKQAELEQVMLGCAGLWLDARSEVSAAAPGDTLSVTLSAVQRTPAAIGSLRATVGDQRAEAALDAAAGTWEQTVEVALPDDAPLSIPHWLTQPPSAARYTIDDPAWRNAPDTPGAVQVDFAVELAGVEIHVVQAVDYTWTDRVHGERRHPVEVLPQATVSFPQRGLLLPEGAPATTQLVVTAPTGPVSGTLALSAPAGITVTPSSVAIDIDQAGAEQVVPITLLAAAGAAAGPLEAAVTVGGQPLRWQQATIDHPHLPRRTVLSPAQMALSPVALERGPAQRIGYVMGSGDRVPDVLRALGYAVDELDEDALSAGSLDRYDAIVLGIRAYNTRPKLLSRNPQLLDYVAGGGRVIVQYNTNGRWTQLSQPIGPAPFTIGRGRVTDEGAALTPLDPDHPALTAPNALSEADFDGWVQERGLYFAETWDSAWTPLFTTHDAGEPPLEGSTLVAAHGEGVFIYTGLSFFRQLPAGVPGAVRLMANLLALEAP